jgi:hypothetical protein
MEDKLYIFFVKKLPSLNFRIKNIIVKLLPFLCLVEIIFLMFFLMGSVILGMTTSFQALYGLLNGSNGRNSFELFFASVSIYMPFLTIPVIIFNIYGVVKRRLVS